MVIKGETIASGAPSTCPECNITPLLKVLKSPAGYYIGTYCNCGPYSRESGYYETMEAADVALITGDFGRG